MSPTTNTYHHDNGFAVISYTDELCSVVVWFDVERRTNDDGEHIAYAVPFPGQLGIGDTVEESDESLQAVLRGYLETFMELNGVIAFQDRLMDFGFKLITDPAFVKKSDPDHPSWVLKLDVPPDCLSGAPA